MSSTGSGVEVNAPRVWHTNRTVSAPMLSRRYVRENESDSFEIPAFLRKQADDEPLVSTSTGLSPAEMIDALNTAAIHASSFSDALQSVQGYDLNAELTPLIKATTKVVGDEQVTWALLIRWLSDRLGAAGVLDRHAERLLRDALSSVDATAVQYAGQKFSEAFSDIAADHWKAVKQTGIPGLMTKVRSVVDMNTDRSAH